jgi:hypothetical protein
MCWWFGSTEVEQLSQLSAEQTRTQRDVDSQSSVLVLPHRHQHSLKMGNKLVPEKSENLFILLRLSAHETSNEFRRRDIPKTYRNLSFCGDRLPQLIKKFP